MIKRILNMVGLVAGVVIVIIAIPHTLKGVALLLFGLVLVGGNIYWLLKRKRAERLAVEVSDGG